MSITENKIEIFQNENSKTEVSVTFEKDTVWLNRNQMSELFGRDVKTIGKHINNIFKESELEKMATVAKFATVQIEGDREIVRKIDYYNLDVIISVGYRVKSQNGTRFRIWATERLRELLLQGYSINKKALEQKNMEIQYLKTGIRILHRAIENQTEESENSFLTTFAKGLEMLDDYDHEELDSKGKTEIEVIYPSIQEYMNVIHEMYSDFESDVFAKPKDNSFDSSVSQIKQTFGGVELYSTLEEKAANLLYSIVKNHSFVDGNKRIAAACFLYFLDMNNMLLINDTPIISNEALASLTLFIASSKSEENEVVKKLIISVLNRSTP